MQRHSLVDELTEPLCACVCSFVCVQSTGSGSVFGAGKTGGQNICCQELLGDKRKWHNDMNINERCMYSLSDNLTYDLKTRTEIVHIILGRPTYRLPCGFHPIAWRVMLLLHLLLVLLLRSIKAIDLEILYSTLALLVYNSIMSCCSI